MYIASKGKRKSLSNVHLKIKIRRRYDLGAHTVYTALSLRGYPRIRTSCIRNCCWLTRARGDKRFGDPNETARRWWRWRLRRWSPLRSCFCPWQSQVEHISLLYSTMHIIREAHLIFCLGRRRRRRPRRL